MIFKTISSKSILLQREVMFRLCSAEQSRRDNTLLTVEFILRTRDVVHALQVPQGRHFEWMIVSSLRDFGKRLFRLFRRLKPTVNQVLSLRDIWLCRVSVHSGLPLSQHYHKLLILSYIVIPK